MCVGSNLDGLIISLDKWLNTFYSFLSALSFLLKGVVFSHQVWYGLFECIWVSTSNYEVGILWLSNKDMLNKAYLFE